MKRTMEISNHENIIGMIKRAFQDELTTTYQSLWNVVKSKDEEINILTREKKLDEEEKVKMMSRITELEDHVAILSPLSDLPRGVIPGAAVRHLHFDQLPVLHCGNSFTISSISSVLVKLFTNFKLNFCTLEACQCLCEKLNYKEKLKNSKTSICHKAN